jgi:predicted amidohydrolase
VTGFMAGHAAWLLNADLRRSTAALLDVTPASVSDLYVELFGGLAREFGITTVAPSAYLPDPLDGVIRNQCAVFDPTGEVLGWQSKVVLHPLDKGLAQPGSTWDVIPTDVGRLGIMLGSDVLYPEVGRILAYQGAEMLISTAACTDLALYNKVRAGMLARMQDNQLFAVSSFLVGANELLQQRSITFMGRSALFAPQELTPRYNGVLVEMGNHRSEGVITAEWDYVALRELWESAAAPVRQQMPLEQIAPILTQLYDRLQKLPAMLNMADLSQLPDEGSPSSAAPTENQIDEPPSCLTLDDLPVLSSVTSRWPLPKPSTASAEEDELSPRSLSEEETEEMDALSDDLL